MSGLGILFLLVNSAALLILPRRLASFPLLVGACYMPLGQGIEVGPFSFPVLRLIILAGFARVILRKERPAGGMNTLDWLMVTWAVWAIISSVFHKNPSAALIYRLGIAYNYLGIYLLFRILCQSNKDIVLLCKMTALILAPVAIEMIIEKISGHNYFSVFGGVSESSVVRRDGSVRSQGPFSHSILAGTIGAVCLPIALILWQRYRKAAMVCIVSCILMVYASNSSGPIMSAIAAIIALVMWPLRYRMKLVCRLIVLGYIALSIVMIDPPYYLMARIDLTGGSTGWHRARLIRSSIEHISEWWIGGTDYTRHWMPTGVSWSVDHTDITNYYLKMGVMGGLPLMLLFIIILAKGFSYVLDGLTVQEEREFPKGNLFMFWGLGAALFAHAVTFLGVSYFDQSFVFLYMALAVISSAWSSRVKL